MFVWYSVSLQSTIIIHVSNYKKMCQVSSVHYQPRYASSLQINIRLSVVVRVDASFRDLLCLLRQPRDAVVLEDFGLHREVGQD